MGKTGKSIIRRNRISANERFEILTTVFTKIRVLGNVVPYRQAKHFQFGRGGEISSSPEPSSPRTLNGSLDTEDRGTIMPVSVHQSTKQNIPEHLELH
jgi:hypothetical protein